MNSDEKKLAPIVELQAFVQRGQQAQRAIDAILAEAPVCACCIDPKRIYPPWRQCGLGGCTNLTRGSRCPQHRDQEPTARQGAPVGRGDPARVVAIVRTEGPPAPGARKREHVPKPPARGRR